MESVRESGVKQPWEPLICFPERVFLSDLLLDMGELKRFIVHAAPMGAPRQTRADRWKKRECVLRYRALCDQIRKAAGPVDQQNVVFAFMRFFFAMPGSWSQKKQDRMQDKPHRSTPDVDNCIKLVVDALIKQDGCVSGVFGYKQWCLQGDERIEITLMSL